MDYKECKFYDIRSRKCLHEDASLEAPGCIGYEDCGAMEDSLQHLKAEVKHGSLYLNNQDGNPKANQY